MVDFDGFIHAATSSIDSARTMENTANFDTDRESTAAKSILIGINKNASKNLDTVEFKKLVDAEKAAITPFVDDAEILSDLMSALSAVSPDLNMEKIKKYNEKPIRSRNIDVVQTVKTSKDGYIGLDDETFDIIEEVLGEDAGKVFEYMSDAIISGSASRIANNQAVFKRDTDATVGIINAIKELPSTIATVDKYEIDGAKRIMDALKEDIKKDAPRFLQ